MIKELYQFGSEYYEKKIFVFGINKDSIDTMLLLSIRKLKVQGFVSDDVKYYGNNIWNIPIVSIEEVNYENSFIIIPKHEKRLPKCFSDKNGVKNIVRYSQMKKTLNQDIFGGGGTACMLWSRIWSF